MGFLKRIKGKALLAVLLATGFGRAGFAQTANTNYTRTQTPRVAVTNAAQLDTIPVQRQSVSVAYTDGLGRPLQSIQVRGSAGLNDIIAPYVYDNMGRPATSYLPYAYQGTSAANAGTYRSGAVSDVLNFYNPASPGAPKIPTDAAPYAQTVYEGSPMGRVVEQGAVGTVFQPGTGHTVKASYQVNSTDDGIYYYNIAPDLSATATAFLPGVLTKTIVTDENGHHQALWKDLQGRTVSRSPQDADYLTMTDYTYNDLGQLSNILTPQGRADFNFAQESYVFKYDSIGRVVEKRVPDKGWEYMVYNSSDKLVLSQDSNLRAKHQWIYLKYDAEGRMVQTGIYTNTTVTGRKAMQYLCDSTYPTLWETWQPGTGYTNNAFPTSTTNLYTTYYYDDYSFPEAGSKPFQSNIYGTVPTGRTMGMLTGASVYVLGSSGQYLATVNYYDNQNRLIQQQGDNHLGYVDVVNNQYNFIGELTASQQVTTALAGSPVTVLNRYVYDPMGRLLDTYETFQGGTEIDISHNVYNEVDQKVSEGLQYKGNNNTSSPPATATNIARNSTPPANTVDVASNSVKLLPTSGGFHFTATSTNSYKAQIGHYAAQVQEFRYNIRGWLTNINNGTLDNDGITQTDPTALFGESITYWESSPLSGNVPQYNGNISGFTWRNRIEASGRPGVTTGGQGYNLEYDSQDRFYKSDYYKQTGSTFTLQTDRSLTETISGYDLMGNISEMYRVDKSAITINDLFYTYHPNSNKLDSIYDDGTQGITGTYAYDGNGNMIADSRKGITITYNYLDLPDTVKKGSSKLVFTYDAAGNKLYKQLIVGGTVVSQKHYVENLEVVATSSVSFDGTVQSVEMDEGRIVNTGGGVFQYEYNMQDHLGTNRVSFRMTTDSTLALSMVQNYYPFGQDMGDSTMNFSLNPLNFYKYNSKELQPELDLDTYDFGARHYDAVLGRWMGVDAMAVLSDDLSPYNYVENNPLNMLDPDGMQPKSVGLPQVNLHDVVIKPGNGGIGPGGIAGAVANGISGFIAAKDAFNINKPVIRQDWGQLVNVQGNIIKPNTQPTISQWQPGFYDKWKESGFLGKFTYDIADQADITAKTFLWPFGGINHLNGQYATPMDQQKSFAYTAMWFIPLGKGGPVIKAVVENVAERAVIEAGEKAVAKEAPQLLLKPAVAELTQQILDHIIERHWFTSGAQGAGKFASGTTGAALKQMIRTATTEGIFRPNTGGRAGVIAEYTFGKVIGTSSKGVAARSIRVVIRGGKVVTAFPF